MLIFCVYPKRRLRGDASSVAASFSGLPFRRLSKKRLFFSTHHLSTNLPSTQLIFFPMEVLPHTWNIGHLQFLLPFRNISNIYISTRNGEQGELTLDLEEQRCFVLDGESGATIRELARWVGNYSKCIGKNLIFHKQPKSLNFDYFGKVAGCWWGKCITLRWRWIQFKHIFRDVFWKSPAEASIL